MKKQEAIEELQDYKIHDSNDFAWGYNSALTVAIDIIKKIDEPEKVVVPQLDNDAVNHPSHYMQGKKEVIEIIEETTANYRGEVRYHIGNAIKYIFRAPLKGNLVQDLEKAIWYLNRAIKLIKEWIN